jgi:GMP synthase-like glutamine amidotransferase
LTVDDCDAYLITGSRHGIYEDLPWIPPCSSSFASCTSKRKKLVGICFGHQAVAQALGGRTEKAAVGWGVGLHRHRFQDNPQPGLTAAIPEFRVLVTHQDQVVANARGAQVLAGSDFCPNAVCQLGDHILTFQGHPEFVNGYSRAIMDFRREILGEDVYQAGDRVPEEQPEVERMAGWILRFLKAR